MIIVSICFNGINCIRAGRSMMALITMKTLNIIGAGRAGRTLTALWFQRKVFAIQHVLNRTPASTRDAVAFIGAGRPAAALTAMQAAGVWLLATPDGEIVRTAASLAANGLGLLRAGDVVFHCSGAMSASDLRIVVPRGVLVASVHPLKSFADPAEALRTFTGTDRKSTRLNSSHPVSSRMPSSA